MTLKRTIIHFRQRSNRAFAYLMIAVSAVMLMLGAVSCKTVKNKQTHTVQSDSSTVSIAKNDIKEIEHTETVGDEWTEEDTLSGDITDSTVIESGRQKIIISKGKVKAIAKKQKVNYKTTTTKLKTDNSVKAENKTVSTKVEQTIKTKETKPPFGLYAIGTAIVALILYIAYRVYKKYF
jgi:hypothetical protein